jgi:cell division protein FtsI (penicillin-binding protein 3)/stage V sporulation protein D (sporulation-specific penicillin-binding protein)
VALAQRRLRLLFALFAALLVVAGLRTAELGLLQGTRLSAVAQSNEVKLLATPATRGAILDRDGRALALTEPGDDVEAYRVADPAKAAAELAPILHVDAATLALKLASHPDNQYLARRLPAPQAQKLAALGIPGISLVTDDIRYYPFGSLAGQLLGGMHANGTGAGGLEAEYDKQLAGTSGETRVAYAGDGKPIAVDVVRKAKPGATIRLTIDAQLQQEVESVLADVGQRYAPYSSTAIVSDPRTGAVLALANWPAANPADPGVGRNWADSAVELSYEPGSTFKIVVVGGALSDGLITPNTSFTIPSVLQFDGRTISDSEPHGDETLTTTGIIGQSSNIGAVEIGQLLGEQRFYDWTRRFGFGAPTGIDLPGEAQGIIPPLSDYNNFSMGNLPFGQGESVTPIQLATAYAAIANGGILRAPHIVAAVGGESVRTPAGHRILTPTVAAELRKILEAPLQPGGTASEISIPGYTLAGKTGTANIAIDGTYSHTKYIASFVGFAPAQHPQVEVTVVVDQPQDGAIYGTDAPAHAWQAIMSWALRYLQIPPG